MVGDFIRAIASLSSETGSVRVLVVVAGAARASRCDGTIAVEEIEGDESDWLGADLLRLNILRPLLGGSFILGSFILAIPSAHVAGGVAAEGGVAVQDTADGEAAYCDDFWACLKFLIPDGKAPLLLRTLINGESP